MAYPDSFHAYDPAGYYKPRPILGAVPVAGPYFHEYPKNPNMFVFDEEPEYTEDPYLQEHLEKIKDPTMKERAKNE